MPMQGMKLAKQAAAESQALLGVMCLELVKLDKRLTALEGADNEN